MPLSMVFDYLDNIVAFLYLLDTMKTVSTIYYPGVISVFSGLAIAIALFAFLGAGGAIAEPSIVEEVVMEEKIATPVKEVSAEAAQGKAPGVVVISGEAAPDGALPIAAPSDSPSDAPLTVFKEKWEGNKFNKRHNKYLKYDKDGQIDASPEVVPLDYLPRDSEGFIDWTKAMSEGLLQPLEAISARRGEKMQTVRYDEDVVLRPSKTFMPDVIFPHDAHNDWLNCGNCHDGIFKMKKKASGITMKRIWKGEFCGRCHDKVAFPLRHCFRCHAGERGAKFAEPKPVEDNYVERYEYE